MAMERSQWSARQAADLPELAAYCGVLARHVAEGGNEGELEAARRILVAMATRQQLGASMIIGAIELVGCPPLHADGPRRPERIDRYTAALANLLRDFLEEPA